MAELVTIFGAAGPTGVLCAQKLLERGNKVRCVDIVDPEKLSSALPSHELLEVVQGDVADLGSVQSAVQGATYAIFAAAATHMSTDAVDHKGAANVAVAAREAGLRRVVLMSSCMVTSRHKFNPIRLMLNSVIKSGMLSNKFKGEEAVRKSGMEYTILRAGRLNNKPGGEHALEVGQGDVIAGDLSRADAADAVIACLDSSATRNVTFELMTKKPPQPAPADQLATLFDGLKPDA